MKTIGIIGAGQMGRGIAQVSIQAGYTVILFDIKDEALKTARQNIEDGLDKLVTKEKITPADKQKALDLLRTSSDMALFKSADLVIEAATENEALKISILKSLLPHLNEHAIIASNTSSISITKLAAATDRPQRFIGIHFMNPVPVMKLVELIRGLATDENTFNEANTFVSRLGKSTAHSSDFPGFIVNRLLIPMINEAIFALFEGVGDAHSIDTAMKLGANHPMGPLELADLIGLDTCLSIMQVLYQGLGDPKYRPCPLLINYVAAGRLGRKSKQGFFSYDTI